MNTQIRRAGLMTAGLSAVVLATTACGSGRAEVQSEPPAGGASALEWTATIRPQTDDGHGGRATATVMSDGSTRVRVSLSEGASGGEHPWHVHVGRCGSGGDIVGSPSAYSILRPDDMGSASQTAILDVSLDPSVSYHVNIHQSSARPDVIVGCGELRRG